MKIAVNLLFLKDNLSGLGIYAVNIINQLSRISDDEYYIFTSDQEYLECFFNERIQFIELKQSGRFKFKRLFNEQIVIPYQIKKMGFDILFTPGFYMPVVKTIKYVTTIHDLIHKTYPGDMNKKNRLLMTLFVDNSVRHSDYLITVSDHTTKDVMKYFKRSENVHKILEGSGNSITEIHQMPKYRVENEPFAIIVGNMMVRKNILGMIQAYQRSSIKKKMKLIIIGNKGYQSESIEKYVIDHHLSENIVMTGYVSNEELNWYYHNAEMLLFCSFYEGFGFPLLEAMKAGTPIIASNKSSIPEICADAAMIVDPYNISEMSEAMNHLFDNKQLQRQLISNGYKRVDDFDWSKAALMTREVFIQAYESR